MKWREVVVAAALWAVLFIGLAPDSIRDGHGFYMSVQAFGAGLAVVVFAAVRAVARVLGDIK